MASLGPYRHYLPSSSSFDPYTSRTEFTSHGPLQDIELQPKSSSATLLPKPDPPVDSPLHHVKSPGTGPSAKTSQLLLWKWQVAAISLSVVLFVAITATLRWLDNRPLSDWPLPIGQNTLIALSATLFRTVIMVPIAAIISQEKWYWFTHEARPLSDLDTFDNASRGATGAALLLPMVLARSPVATIGALITISSLAIGSFVQQAIQAVPCSRLIPSEDASIPVIRNFTNAGYTPVAPSFWVRPEQTQERRDTDTSTYEALPDLTANMAFSLLKPLSPDNAVRASCSTGNCEFPGWGLMRPDNMSKFILSKEADRLEITHVSSGICSKCLDVSSHAIVDERKVELWGAQLQYEWQTLSVITLNSSESRESYLKLLDAADNPSFNHGIGKAARDLGNGEYADLRPIVIIASSRTPCDNETSTNQSRCFPPSERAGSTASKLGWKGFIASACIPFPCLQSYNGHIKEGLLKETVLGIQIPTLVHDSRIPGPHPQMRQLFASAQSPCRLDGVNYNKSNIDNAPHLRPEKLTVFPTQSIDDLKKPGLVDISHYPWDCIHTYGDFLWRIIGKSTENVFNGDCRIHMFGTSCGQNTPLYGLLSGGTNFSVTPESIDGHMSEWALAFSNRMRMAKQVSSFVTGSLVQPDTCFKFYWHWLLFPAALVVLSSVLLINTLVSIFNGRHSNAPVWQDSLLPLFFYHGNIADSNQGSTKPGERATEQSDLLDLRGLKNVAKRTQVQFHSIPGSDGHERRQRNQVRTPGDGLRVSSPLVSP